MTSTSRERKRLLKNIDALKAFANSGTVRKLRKELKTELAALEKKSAKQAPIPAKLSKRQVKVQANAVRSSKLRKYHNYLRQIRDNYPNITYSDVRKMFKIRKEGRQVEIPDVIWQNPSP